MADEKRGKRGAKGLPPAGVRMGDDGKPAYTTFRIFAEDGEDLSELADQRNTTIAKLYHEQFAAKVRELLIEETRNRLRRLESRE